jgi:hypothetical protein
MNQNWYQFIYVFSNKTVIIIYNLLICWHL